MTKINLLVSILLEKRHFTFNEVFTIAEQITNKQTANYIAIEALYRITSRHRPKIVIR